MARVILESKIYEIVFCVNKDEILKLGIEKNVLKKIFVVISIEFGIGIIN